MSYLVLFTVGPVQSFISQARKTQDMYAASLLLSDLTKKLLFTLEEKAGKTNVDVIFPAFQLPGQGPVKSVPNRFLAVVEGDPDIRQLFIAVKEDALKQFRQQLMKKMSFLNNDLHSLAENQIKSLFEVYWAAIPYEDDYAKVYRELSGYMAGIKQMRWFHQLDETGRKCSVDGERNALLYRRTNAERGDMPSKFSSQSIAVIGCEEEKDVKAWELQPGEGLSAVSFAKRTYDQQAHRFPSTAKVALMHWIDQVKDLETFKRFRDKIEGEGSKKVFRHSDDQLYFEENLTAKRLEKYGAQGALQELVGNYQEMLQEIRQKELMKPTLRYYALLVFDGDYMGQWLSGEFLEDKSMLRSFQEKLRDCLSIFGKWVVEEGLKEPQGAVVYAGGDDFLGFVNLHHVWTVLKSLRRQFEILVNEPVMNCEMFSIRPGHTLSFSAGVAIAHYKQPLSLVLESARKAEQLAKEQVLKNSFAISLIRHSGGITTCVQPFGVDEYPSLQAIRYITEQLAKGSFSNAFIHNFIAESQYWRDEVPVGLLDIELSRLIKRAASPKNGQGETGIMKEQVGLLSGKSQGLHPVHDHQSVISNLTNSLLVCDFIHRCIQIEHEYENT